MIYNIFIRVDSKLSHNMARFKKLWLWPKKSQICISDLTVLSMLYCATAWNPI